MANTPLGETPPLQVHFLVQVTSKAAMLHRSRFDIIATILQTASDGGARKTHIMYKCNLSFKQLHSYLEFLVEMGLLRAFEEPVGADESLVRFETSKKGKDFIRAYKNLNALLTRE